MGGIGPTASETGEETQQFALKWNDFHKSITNAFRDLRDGLDFVDVTIACDGLSFQAHKVVLSACSPYFRSLLKANPCPHPIVILQDVRQRDMEALLRFMYNGEVHIGEDRLNDFLKTAQTLQVRGLADVSSKDQHKLSNMSSSVPWSSGDASQSVSTSKRSVSGEIRNHSPSKKARHSPNQTSRYSVSPPVNRDSISSDNADGKPSSLSDSVHSLQQGDERSQSAQNSHPDDSGDESYDEEASDAEMDPNDIGNASAHDLAPSHPADFAMSDRSKNDSLVVFDPQRQQQGGFSNIPFALQSFPDLANFLPGLQLRTPNSQDSYGLRKNSEGKVRATDPRPCPKCKKIYRSAHTLRTHMEDKHTICPGYRCVLCGTVAKSRNSLHSHMSRQHRGISTKELPVVPMPAPFDPELASRLFGKAGITVTPEELRARASPPSTAVTLMQRPDARPDIGSPDNNSSSPDDDPQDLSINSNRRPYRVNQKEFSPLDFHNASMVNMKDNNMFGAFISQLLPALNTLDKENLDS